MDDSRERLWQLAIAAKQRELRRLERTLTAQRQELASLEQEASARHLEEQHAVDTLHECERNIDCLMRSSEPIPAQRFLDYGTWRQQLEERTNDAKRAHEKAVDAVGEKKGETMETCRNMARVDNQSQRCESLLTKARNVREEAFTSQIEEEAAEVIAMRVRMSRQVC